MRLFWRPKQPPVSVSFDESALTQRVNRVMPLVEEAALQALEQAQSNKARRVITSSFRKMAKLAESLSGEQLTAFLDAIEAGMPEEFKARLQ